jgi:hypothetical protein
VRLGRAGLLGLLLITSACRSGGVVITDGGGDTGGAGDLGGSIYVPCTTLCYRPSDCALAYPNDGYCPPGFRCSLNFRCDSDGGTPP